MRVLSLFSGIGGLELGLEWAGMETAGQCEFDRYCRNALEKHWPTVPRWIDIRSLTGEWVRNNCGNIDLICGGFPCQDISVAGKGAGITGARSGLWQEMRRVIGEVRPRWVLAENVPALRTRGADEVLGQLEELGYSCWPCVVGAVDVGAYHRRKRVWIVAYSHQQGLERWHSQELSERASERLCPRGRSPAPAASDADCNSLRQQRQCAGRDGASPPIAGQGVHDMADTNGQRWAEEGNRRLPQHADPGVHGKEGDVDANTTSSRCCSWSGLRIDAGTQRRWQPAGSGEDAADCDCKLERRLAVARSQCGQWLPEPGVGRVADGVPCRMDRLRCLGNAVVPQIAEQLGRAIMEVELAHSRSHRAAA